MNVALLDAATVQRLRRGTATSLGIYVICAVGLCVVATLAAPVRAEEQENARVTTNAYIDLKKVLTTR